MHRSWKQHAAKGSTALLLLHACPRRLCGNSPGRIDTSCLSKMTVSKMCRKKYINIYIYLFSLQTGPLLYLSTLGTIHLCPMLAAVPFSRWLPPACTSLCSLLKCSYFAREPLHPPPKKNTSMRLLLPPLHVPVHSWLCPTKGSNRSPLQD